MKKIILCLLMFISLSACHGSKDIGTFTVLDNFDESVNYELTFWAKNDTNKTQVAIYEKAISDFEELYPNIKINLRLYTDYGRIYNDVITNIQTGTTPNVCITYPDHIATYISGDDIVVPLDKLIEDEKYGLGGKELKFQSVNKDEIISSFLKEGEIKGVSYALPFMRSTEACYVNKTYVEKLGFEIPEILTWDFIYEVSTKAMEKDDNGNFLVNGQNILIPVIYKSTDNMMIQSLYQLGEFYTDENANIGLFNDTTKEILFKIADATEKGLFSTFKISSYPANFLNAGQCIFAIDSTAGATWMGSEAPLIDISEDKIVNFETVVKEVPQLDVNNIKMISQGPSICIFNKEDKGEVLASWIFMQYLLTNEVQIAYAETEGYVPVTNNALNDSSYQEYLNSEGMDSDAHYDVKIKASKMLLEHLDDTFVTDVYNGSASLRDAAGQLIENVVKSVRRKETIDDKYMENLFNDVASLYHLDQIGGNQEINRELGPLPTTSIILISVLAIIWILIISYFINDRAANKHKS